MTNLSIVVTLWVNIVTNPVPAGVTLEGQNFYTVSSVSSIQQYLPDGAFLNASAMSHHSYVTNSLQGFEPTASRSLRSFKPPPLPPSSGKLIRGSIGSAEAQVAGFGNGGPDLANYCLMFQTRATTRTNFIYALESSRDLVNWTLCPPEIDGTGQEESFWDECLTNQVEAYRIASRVGVLPP